MSWTFVIWLMSAGICITLAAVHLLLWLRDRNAQESLAFSLWTMAVAVSALFELPMIHSQTPENYAVLLRAAAFPFAAMAIAYITFIRLYLRAGWRWLMWFIFGIVALELIVKATILPTLPFVEIADLQQIALWGETLVAPVGVKSPWRWITGLLVISELAFIGNAAVEAWRRGRRSRVKIVAVAVCCSTAFAVAIAVFVMQAELPPPITFTLPSMLTILVMAYGLSTDFLKASQMSQDLQKHRDYLEHLINSIPDMVFSVKLPERTIEWARDPYNVLGHNLDDYIGKTTEELYSSVEEHQSFGKLLKKAIRDNKNTVIAETMLRNKNGESIPVEINTTIYRDKDEPVSVISLVRDISDRKKSQEELKKSEARLKDAQRIAHIGNWELDLSTDTLTWSDEIFRIFEIDKKRFGASYEFFLSTVHPEDREAVNTAYTQSLRTREPYAITHRLLMPDGRTKYVQEQCETFYSPEGKPLRSLGTVQDITVHKEAESERIQLRNDLAHAQRVSTMGHISSALAHELNQPLGAILNNASAAQILRSKLEGENTELGEILADIISDARRAGQVVREIRGIVKKAEVKFEQLNVNVLIEEAVALYRNAFNLKKISSSLDLQPDLSPVRGDRIHLQQVFMNLINNASEAMSESPSKTLKIRSTMQSPDLIIVSVVDSGTGIDEAKKEKIFDQFFTTKKDGLGMGLRICQSIIEEHGGRIWVENNPAGGAIFSFSLKAYRGDSG